MVTGTSAARGTRGSLASAVACAALLGGLAGLAALAGCGTGSIELTLQLPEDEQLRPAPATTVTMVAYLPGAAPRATTSVLDDDAGFDLGELPVAVDVEVEVELRSATQRLVGFGRTKAPFTVSADADASVTIPVRRPFVYTTGSTRLATLDSSRDIGEEYQGSVTLPEPPRLAITVAGDLAVISGDETSSEVRLVSTSTHTVADVEPIALGGDALDAAASRDGRWLVVGHGSDGGISVVDLDAARAGERVVTTLDVGSVGAIAIGIDPSGGERAYALIDEAAGPACNPHSKIATIRLDDLGAPPTMGDAGSPLTDIAASHLAVGVLGADACDGAIVVMQPDEISTRAVLTDVPNPTSIAILGDRIWAVGNVPSPNGAATGAHVVLVTIGIGGGEAARFDLPPARESVAATEIGNPGQEVLQRLNATTIEGLDLAILPGGEQLALLTRAAFHGDVVNYPGPFGDVPVIPEMDFDTWELSVVSSNGRVSQRIQAKCEGVIINGAEAVLEDWACADEDGQDLPIVPEFEPRMVSALYGAR